MRMIQKTQKKTDRLQFLHLCQNVLPDDKIAKGTNSLDLKERKVFNVVHIWAQDYVKYNGHNVKPGHIFLYI